MKLRSLQILRMPGFEIGGPALDELAPGLNLVLGPNGSGKTTSARAIRGLLWPGTLEGVRPVEVSGRFELDGEDLMIELSQGQLRCQRDGLEGPAPDLPPEHLAGCFTISVDDLFAGSRTDSELAQRIALQMAGGYDLPSARESEPFDIGARHGKREARELKQADHVLQDLQAGQRELLDASEGLAELQRRKTAAAAARDSIVRLERALELCQARASLSRAEALLAGFPEGLDALKGDELERLDQILGDRAAESEALGAARRLREAAAADISDLSSLPRDGPSTAELGIQRARVEEAQTLATSRSSLERELASAGARGDEAARKLGALDAEAADRLDRAGLDRLDELYRRTVQTNERENAVRQEMSLLQTAEAEVSLDQLEVAAHTLREWLRCPAAAGASPAALRLAWIACGLVVLGGVGLGVAISLWSLLLLIPALFLGVAIRWIGTGPKTDDRRAIERRLAELPVSLPGAWVADAVLARLAALEREIVAARQDDERRGRRVRLESEAAELAQQARAIVGEWAGLRKDLGLSEDVSPLSRMQLVERLFAFQQARDERAGLQAKVEAIAEQERSLLAEAQSFLEDRGLGLAADATEARALTDELVKRVERRADARERLAESEERIARGEARVAELEAREASLFQGAGIAAGDRDELDARLAQLQGYADAASEVQAARLEQDALEERLGDLADLGELSEEALTRRRTEAEERAGEYEALVDRIKDVELKVDAAGRGRALEQALDDLARAQEALAERRDEALLAAAGQFLLDEVESEHEQEARPEVLEQAGRLFAAFTLGRYELKLDPEEDQAGAAFRAVDRRSGRGFALEELSRGTRMQLLLAARIAFAKGHEGEHPLPLLLDEALSSTDPERFRAVVQSLLALARDGRQVIYFTCQPADALAWETLCAADGFEPMRRIELASSSGAKDEAPALPPLSSAAHRPLPGPEDRDLGEYADLVGAPAFDPLAPLGEMHLAHVADDSAQLFRLLTIGIRVWGQVHTLARMEGIQAYLQAEELARLSARAELMHALAETWRVGRGKPVHGVTLERAGVSESYLERIGELAADLDGDAAALIEAIRERTDERAKGFRTAALESLEAYLLEKGYLDPRPTVSQDQAWARVLAVIGEHLRAGRLEQDEAHERFLRYWPD